jgi:elongation factor Ts
MVMPSRSNARVSKRHSDVLLVQAESPPPDGFEWSGGLNAESPAQHAGDVPHDAAPGGTPTAHTNDPTPVPAVDGAAISAATVKELRQMSGAGMMDCKKALIETGGDVQKAQEWLRVKGMASADKKQGRIAAEGVVIDYIHAGSRIGVLVEVNCETDFVSRGDKFKELAKLVAMQIAACPEVEYISPADCDPAMIAREKEIEMKKEDLQSKPENIREKIVQGRMDKLVNEKALLTKAYIKDTSKTVEEVIKEATAELGEKISIRRFEKYNLGEGIEKRESNFAAEIADMTAVKAEAPKPTEEPKKEEATDDAPVEMVAVSAAAVKELRQMSGAGMMDCKKALGLNDGDIQKAQEWLRVKGMASADKKQGRVASEGGVCSYIHAGSKIGVLVEVNCETDFVARGDKFKDLSKVIAMQIAAHPEVEYISSADCDPAMIAREKEIEMKKEDLQSKPENIREKIVQGRIDKMVNDKALLPKAYIKDPSKTVEELIKEATAELGEKISIRRFKKFNLGEGIEKKESNFAQEIADMAR